MEWGERRTIRFEANAWPQFGPGKQSGIGRHRARRGANQQPFGDRFKIGAEMHRALVYKDRLFGRLIPT